MHRSTSWAAALVIVAAASLASSTAHGQDNSAAVEALFGEGKRLATEGKFAEACPKFLASYNLEHRLGTLLNLADCYEKNHQLASAWARFVEARTLASRANQADRAEFSAQHAAVLEPKLAKLTIKVAQPAPQLDVRRDGVALDPGAYGVAVAVDVGRHKVEASAPDKKPWSGEITVTADGEVKTVEVPALVDAPKPIEEQRHGGLSGRAVAGIAITVVGVVAVGVGSTFGALALSKNGDSSQYCNIGGVKDDCLAPGVALRSDAVTFGNAATGLIIGGAVAFGVGLVVWLTAPSGRVKAGVGFDGRTLNLRGTF